MCLLVVAWQAHPRYPLVVAANRDEFHERPTAPMAKWPPPNDILAGRDLRANGTWLALDRQRRFGVVTNFRDLQKPQPQAPSRGNLVPRFLSEAASPSRFLAMLAADAGGYAGFNLLLADTSSLGYASNRTHPFARALPPGVYGLSNQLLDTPWPKLRRVRQEFETWLAQPRGSTDELLAMLADRTRVAADEDLPRTGLPTEWERILSSPFVLHPDYGTRSSTVLLLEHSGAFVLIERRFGRQGETSGESKWAVNAADWP